MISLEEAKEYANENYFISFGKSNFGTLKAYEAKVAETHGGGTITITSAGINVLFVLQKNNDYGSICKGIHNYSDIDDIFGIYFNEVRSSVEQTAVKEIA